MRSARPLLFLLLLGACSDAPSDRIDLVGMWDGTFTNEDDQASRLTLTLTDSVNGTWRFVDEPGEGLAAVFDDRVRTIRIRLTQQTPCTANYDVDALLADTDLLEGTISGSDCSRLVSSGVQLRRTP